MLWCDRLFPGRQQQPAIQTSGSAVIADHLGPAASQSSVTLFLLFRQQVKGAVVVWRSGSEGWNSPRDNTGREGLRLAATLRRLQAPLSSSDTSFHPNTNVFGARKVCLKALTGSHPAGPLVG